MGPTVAFRVDASERLGTGHVMRCLTLASQLRREGASCRFVCRTAAGDLGDYIAAQGFEVHRLPAMPEATWQEDAAQTAEALGDTALDWLVVDHYGLDARWERQLRSLAPRLMAIDDMADRPHDADVLLDQNLFAQPEARYTGLVPAGCTLLLGPAYALLRDEFQRAETLVPAPDRAGRTVMIFFGQADFPNMTGRVLEALAGTLAPADRVEVVLGASHPHEAAIRAQAEAMPQVRVHRFVEDMAARLAASDLFIGAGGATSWERCALSVPSVVVAIAANQQPVAEALAETGAILYLGTAAEATAERLRAAIAAALDNPHWRRAASRIGRGLVDGRGVRRVAAHLLAAPIALRAAGPDDAELMHRWRNHEATRRFSFDSSPVTWETHLAWFTQSLQRADRLLLIGEQDGVPVGVLRYDLDGDRATISVYVDPQAQHQGLGRRLIREGSRWLRAHQPAIHEVVAQIMAANVASQKAFLAAGYTPASLTYHDVLRVADAPSPAPLPQQG